MMNCGMKLQSTRKKRHSNSHLKAYSTETPDIGRERAFCFCRDSRFAAFARTRPANQGCSPCLFKFASNIVSLARQYTHATNSNNFSRFSHIVRCAVGFFCHIHNYYQSITAQDTLGSSRLLMTTDPTRLSLSLQDG